MEEKERSFEYKVVEPHDDYKKAVIEKSGVYAEKLTLEECEMQRIKWSDEKREFEGQLVVEKAKADNIEEHHPFVKEMKEEDLYTAWMYYEANRKRVQLEKYIKQRNEALDVYLKEEQHIMDVLGFKKTQTPAPTV